MTYLPFGGYRPGSAPTQTITDRDFTGQKENMELGLLYYNARFYVPGIGRFASADTLVPDPMNPQQFNRYSYVLGNPLTFNDPTGHMICAEEGSCQFPSIGDILKGAMQAIAIKTPRPQPALDDNNLTEWLASQMRQNGTGPVAKALGALWQTQNPIAQSAVLVQWTALVATDAIWDFKFDILQENIQDSKDEIVLGEKNLNFQAVANIHYGFVGRMIGMSEGVLQGGAGLAQIENGVDAWMQNWSDYPQGMGDQHFDAWAVGFGFHLYDRYGHDPSQLTGPNLTTALDEYIHTNPIPPGP